MSMLRGQDLQGALDDETALPSADPDLLAGPFARIVVDEAQELTDANVPTSVRSTGIPVTHGSVADLDSVLATWLAAHADGVACVIGDPTFQATTRVRR
jgi:hypothetical protein